MPVSIEDRLQLMAGQLGIWHAQQLQPDNPIYNIAEYVEIRGYVDTNVFERAIRTAVGEAELFNMRFDEDESGMPFLWFAPSDQWEFFFFDLTNQGRPRTEAENWMRADVNHVADLRSSGIFTEALFKIEEDLYIWYQRTHHIIADGFSGSLMAARVAELYTALASGTELPERTFPPITKLLDADAQYRSSPDYEADRKFWIENLAYPPKPVSLSASQPTASPYGLTRHTEKITPATSSYYKSAARRLGTSLTVAAVAAGIMYLHRATSANDIVIGLPVMGRVGSTLRTIPGMTANVLPIRLTIHHQTTALELVRSTSEAIRQALRHQRYRYEDLLRDASSIRMANLYSLIVNVMAFDYDLTFGEASSSAHNVGGIHFNDLSLSVYDRSTGGISIVVDANPALYNEEAVTEKARHFLSALDWICRASFEDRITHFEVLEHAERHRILRTWNDTAAEVPQAVVPELFEAQVNASPNAVAVVFDDQEMTYQELNGRANQLARLLVARGVVPESLVAIALPRSTDLIVAMLAILKAGGAYLPIDPEYPTNRITYMLNDARPAALLTCGSLRDTAPDSVVPTVILDAPGIKALVAGLGETDLTNADQMDVLRPEHPAYVIYTSGSTGRPKGVVIRHQGVVN